METCPFCQISKENRVIKQGNLAYVILSNPRLMPGHLLVIPKRHLAKISELSKEETEEIFSLLAEFQEKILAKISSGCDIRQNFKPYVKSSRLSVDHLHFHLLPRNFKDELYEKVEKHKEPLFQELPGKEKEEISALLAGFKR